MELSIFFLLTFLICSLFVVMQKKLTIVENTFIYLLILVISINFSWIVAEELKFIKISEDPIKYTVFFLQRSIIIPMMIVLQLNMIQRTNSRVKAFFISIASIAILLTVLQVSYIFKIAEYPNWNMVYNFIYFVILHLIAFYVHKFFRKVDCEVNFS